MRSVTARGNREKREKRKRTTTLLLRSPRSFCASVLIKCPINLSCARNSLVEGAGYEKPNDGSTTTRTSPQPPPCRTSADADRDVSRPERWCFEGDTDRFLALLSSSAELRRDLWRRRGRVAEEMQEGEQKQRLGLGRAAQSCCIFTN